MADSDRNAAAAIERALLAEDGLSPEEARDIAFHMTDWLSDLRAYSAFVDSPDDLSPEEVSNLIGRLLIHVPNHLAAAAALWGQPVENLFGVDSLDSGGHG